MAPKLTSLTDDQRALMPAVRDEWIAAGLSCEPADRGRAEAGVRAAYAAAHLPPPRFIVWLSSPFAGAVATALWPTLRGQVGGQVLGQVGGQVGDQVLGQVLGQVRGQVGGQVGGQVRGQVLGQVGGQVRGQVRGQVLGQVGDQVGDQVLGQVRGQVRDQVLGQVLGQVGGQVRDQVLGQVLGQVGGQVRDQVGDQVLGQVRDQVGPWQYWIGGNLYADYYAFYEYFARVGIKGMEPIAGQIEVAHAAGMWWPLADICILTDRPEGRIYGEQVAAAGWGSHQMHRTDGPALRYRDGWSLHAWHGTVVPAWVIEAPTAERIQGETNTEIRRCAIESYGWDRYLAELNVTPVDEAEDPGNPGHVLRLYDLPETAQLYGEPVRLIVMDNASRDRDGSRRTYAETVPADCPDAIAAAAWQFDMKPDVYRSLARAT